MSKPSHPTCTRCGAPIPVGTTDELCPACLMSGALKVPEDETLPWAPGLAASLPKHTEFPCEFGGYRLRGLLGRGGMGTVYDAEQIATGRRVALKMLGHGLDSPEMRQRFLREGRLAASVSHPNSLYIFGAEEIAGAPVITMEIAGSGTLKDMLRRRGPLSATEAVDAILDVIAGLDAACQAGVLHRDIKPSNCFVTPDGSVKIGDFGLSVSTLAKDTAYVTAAGAIMGTPAYASPEQLRGDELDLRADIYSVGATLFTLLTCRAPFDGENAVQVVANAVNQKPKPLTEFRDDLPPGLERVVTRCLAKEPDGRYADYSTLCNALLPFSSKEPEPASMLVRASAGWIDYLIAFLPPYLALMLLVGAQGLLVQPLVDRTFYSARFYFVLLGFGFLYFTIVEGIWGAGLGKWLKGLCVIRPNGRPPGFSRALIRICIPILSVEAVRMPLTMAFISDPNWSGLQTALFVVTAVVCGWIPVLLTLRARRENGFATLWDLASGTRVVVKPKGTTPPSIMPEIHPEAPAEDANSLGPFRIVKEMVPGEWIVATDPVLRRSIWLLQQAPSKLSLPRRNVARPGCFRWLQELQTPDANWDALEATEGVPFADLVEGGRHVPWGTLRHWLHDLASEMWAATGDQTLPAELSLDHIWITKAGHAVLLDRPWPGNKTCAELIPVRNLAGQQSFLNAVAAHGESTSLPLHARPVLKNLEDGKFEKLSFLTGTLRGLLDKPAEVSSSIRAGSLFVLPLYVWVAGFVGYYHDKQWDSVGWMVMTSALVVLGVIAVIQLLELPFRSTASQFTFGLAVVDAKGKPAGIAKRLARWAIVWLPLFLPMSFVALLIERGQPTAALTSALTFLLLWIAAAVYAVIHPNRGLHDRLTSTWIVRR